MGIRAAYLCKYLQVARIEEGFFGSKLRVWVKSCNPIFSFLLLRFNRSSGRGSLVRLRDESIDQIKKNLLPMFG